MSEKNKAGLNEVDRQAVVVAWIVANDGCFKPNGWVSCSGEGGFFDSTPCPLASQLQTESMSAPVCDPDKRVVAAKDWLEKYHQRKAEAVKEHERAVEPESRRIGTKRITAMEDGMFLVDSELVRSGAIIKIESPGDTFIIEVCNEKPEAEAAKKQEQKAKPEPVKPCGNCRHTPLAARFPGVESSTTRCFKKEISVPVGFVGCPDFEPRAEEASSAAAITSIDPSPFLLKKASSVISRLKKENAELQSTSAHLRKELAWQFEQLTKKIGTLQDQNDRLQRELDAAKRAENDSRLYWNKEHERALQRIKELERESGERSWPPRPRFFL